MEHAIVATINDDEKKFAFDTKNISQICKKEQVELSSSYDGRTYFLTIDDYVYKIIGKAPNGSEEPYFILLNSKSAVSVSNYTIISEIKELPGNLVAGTDEDGVQHTCPWFHPKQNDSEKNI